MEGILLPTTERASPSLPDNDTAAPGWSGYLLETTLIIVCTLAALYAQEICEWMYMHILWRRRPFASNSKLRSEHEKNLDGAPFLDGTEASDEDLCSVVEVPAAGSSRFNFLSPLSHNTPTPQKKKRYYKNMSPFHSKNRKQPKPLTLIPEETASNLDDSQRQSPLEQLLSASEEEPTVSTSVADSASINTEEDEATLVRSNASPPQRAVSSSSFSGSSPTEIFPARRSSSTRIRKSVVSAATLRSKLKKSLPANAQHAVSSSTLLSSPQLDDAISESSSRRRSHYGECGRSASLSQLERVIRSQEDSPDEDSGCFMIETTHRRGRRNSSASHRRSQSERHLKEDYRLLERMSKGRRSVLPPTTVQIGSPTALHSHPSDLSSTE